MTRVDRARAKEQRKKALRDLDRLSAIGAQARVEAGAHGTPSRHTRRAFAAVKRRLNLGAAMTSEQKLEAQKRTAEIRAEAAHTPHMRVLSNSNGSPLNPLADALVAEREAQEPA